MTQEEKNLLLKDLCARLPYGVKLHYHYANSRGDYIDEDRELDFSDVETLKYTIEELGIESIEIEWKPYLRPMSSMTKEEREELSCYENGIQRADFYYSHHIDCRFMIEKGLALEAREGMYEV